MLAFGSEMLWYPIGWTGGYLVMLALVAAPLRRSGAYTVPDFAECCRCGCEIVDEEWETSVSTSWTGPGGCAIIRQHGFDLQCINALKRRVAELEKLAASQALRLERKE